MDQFFKITILVWFFIFKIFLAIFVFFCGFGFFFVIGKLSLYDEIHWLLFCSYQ
jgi:hypothetical protein